MYRHNRVRTRILREMFDGLTTKGTGTAEAPVTRPPLPETPQTPSEQRVRWWRVGRLFRRSDKGHGTK